jgi:hypothetical protein
MGWNSVAKERVCYYCSKNCSANQNFRDLLLIGRTEQIENG